MKTKSSRNLGLLMFLAMSSIALAQKEKEGAFRWQNFPKPMEKIVFNALDLEQEGLFKIKDVEFGRIGFGNHEAMIWTLETQRPVSFRHIEIIFEPFRKVRFYQIFNSVREGQDKYLRERHDTILHLDQRVKRGAANSQILSRNELFRVWIYMEGDEVGLVVNSNARRMMFTKPPQLK